MSETKLDESLPTTQFILKGYQFWSRKDGGKYCGDLIKFVKNGFTCKTIPEYISDKIVDLFHHIQATPIK